MDRPKLLSTVLRSALPGDEEVLTRQGDQATALIINATGAVVADLCDGTRTVDDIAAFIADIAPGAELESVRQDVERLVGELRSARLLEQA